MKKVLNINKIIAPIYMVIRYKTKKDKNVSLTMNWYRNIHFIVNNNLKQEFKEIMKPQLEGIVYSTPITINYKLYRRRKADLDNWQAVVTKYFQDALVECGCIQDDNFDYIKMNTYEVLDKDVVNPRFEITINEYKKG